MCFVLGLLWWLSGKESACNAGDMGLIPGFGRSPEKEMATNSSILSGKSHGQRSLEGYGSSGTKESAKTSQLNINKILYLLFVKQMLHFGHSKLNCVGP